MDNNYKTLDGLTADRIDLDKISNSRLKEIINDILGKNNKFVFSFLRPGHTDDHTEFNSRHYDSMWDDRDGGGHSDSGGHTDEHEDHSDYQDHIDHIDYSESQHTETHYSQARHHSDSYARDSRDYNELVHTDKSR